MMKESLAHSFFFMDEWICFTCRETYNLTWDGSPAYDEVIENEEEIPVEIHYQCANCRRFARYHRLDSMPLTQQITYRAQCEHEKK